MGRFFHVNAVALAGLLFFAPNLSIGASQAYTDSSRFIMDSISDLQSCDCRDGGTTPHDRVTVTCYYPDPHHGATCPGGGDFDRGNFTAGSCHSGDSPNGATIIWDADDECWYRKNFGVNGVADARQCGVVGDGATDDTAALNTCLSLANKLSIPIVNTGGGMVLINSGNVEIPSNTVLSCGGIAGGQDKQLPL